MKKAIIIIFIILLIVLIGLTTYTITLSKKSNNTIEVTTVSEPKTVKDVIEKYNCEYQKEEKSCIELVFCKDLFDEKGKSNESFFNNIIEDLKPFYEQKSYTLLDEKNNIKIYARYNSSTNDYTIFINDVENFFDTVNGESYSSVDTMHISTIANINPTDEILGTLELNSSYFDSIEELLGEGKELDNGYTSYLNGTVRLRLSPIKTVRNIIFSEDYEGNLSNKIKFGASLKDIYAENSANDFGSIADGYLGYINNDFYIFFYNNETSVYSYTYKYNKDFEELLEDYLKTKDLDTFITRLVNKWKVYDYYEYNPNTKDAYVLFSTRGIEIDIKNNNSKGIKLYSNYYFSDKTKEYVKSGLVTLEKNTDLVDKIEKQRRNNK